MTPLLFLHHISLTNTLIYFSHNLTCFNGYFQFTARETLLFCPKFRKRGLVIIVVCAP